MIIKRVWVRCVKVDDFHYNRKYIYKRYKGLFILWLIPLYISSEIVK